MPVLNAVLWILGVAFAVGLAVVGLLLLVLAMLAWVPLPLRTRLAKRESRDEVASAEGGDSGFALLDGCASIVHRGNPGARTCVLLHGLSSCPAQFAFFATLLAGQGWNVRVPRMPWHGEAEELSQLPLRLRIAELLHWAGSAVDDAVGDGGPVDVVGLSAGATLGAWLAQTRSDIRHAICLAPFLGPSMIPPRWTGAVTRLLVRLPNRMVWWDPRAKAALPRPPHALPWFATRPAGEVMWLGLNLMRSARRRPPLARRVTLVVSECDLAIQPELVRRLHRAWNRHGVGQVRFESFSAADGVPHDCIDPAQPDEVTSQVYPRVLQWLGE